MSSPKTHKKGKKELEKFHQRRGKKVIFVAKKHQRTTLEINTERDKEEEEEEDKELLSNSGVVLVAFFIFCRAFEKSRTLCVVVRTLVRCIRGGPGG
tara:strand:- start:2284 stop:2574 length:291 start_codon:yes stop_codon:yes gene_type:complete